MEARIAVAPIGTPHGIECAKMVMPWTITIRFTLNSIYDCAAHAKIISEWKWKSSAALFAKMSVYFSRPPTHFKLIIRRCQHLTFQSLYTTMMIGY
jgi:hypothetical protein